MNQLRVSVQFPALAMTAQSQTRLTEASSETLHAPGRSHRAELTAADEDTPFKKHAGIQLQQVPHVHSHDQLRQVPLNKHTHSVSRAIQTQRYKHIKG